jgi:hypothetical protein
MAFFYDSNVNAVLIFFRGHCMRQEMPFIPVDRVVDKKRIIRKE